MSPQRQHTQYGHPPCCLSVLCGWTHGLFTLLMNDSAMNIYLLGFVWTYAFASLEHIPRSRISGSCSSSMFTAKLFSSEVIIPLTCCDPSFFHHSILWNDASL